MVAKQYFGQSCSVDGCSKRAVTRAMCGMHYQRWKKLGHPDAARPERIKDGRVVGTHGYVSVWAPNHPLAREDGYVFEHRKVVYDAGIPVPEGHHVHHINGVKDDNRLENLEVVDPTSHMRMHLEGWDTVTNQFGSWPVSSAGCCLLCDQPAKSRGLCNSHYLRWQRGRLEVEGLPSRVAPLCGLR